MGWLQWSPRRNNRNVLPLVRGRGAIVGIQLLESVNMLDLDIENQYLTESCLSGDASPAYLFHGMSVETASTPEHDMQAPQRILDTSIDSEVW